MSEQNIQTIISNKRFSKFIFLWLPVLLWASVIFIFSSYPTVSTSQFYWQDFVVKKLAHIVVYGILSMFLYRALKESGIDKERSAYLSIFIAILYGISDEFHQSFTPGREPHFRDVIFDTIGASLSIYFIWRLLPKAPKRLRNWAAKLQLT